MSKRRPGFMVGMSGVLLVVSAASFLRLARLDFDHEPAYPASAAAFLSSLLVFFVPRRWVRAFVGLAAIAVMTATAWWLFEQGERYAFMKSFHYSDISYTLILNTILVLIARALLSTREADYHYGSRAERAAMREREALDRAWVDETAEKDSTKNDSDA